MRPHIIVLILFALFLLEGTVMPWLIPDEWHTRIVPHFVFAIVLYSAVYMNRHYALFFGLLFGMLHDVVFYGHMIGVYTFSMGLGGYATGLVLNKNRLSLPLMTGILLIGNVLFDSTVWSIYTLFKVIQDPYTWALVHHILPSLLLNVTFALALYLPLKKLWEGADKSKKEEEQS